MDTDTLISLYASILRIRIVEEVIAELYSEQEMRCPVHLCVGQEAAPAGVCAHLSKKDYVLSGHRSHGHYLAKGGDLKVMMAEIYGKAAGCSQGKGGSMHLVDLDCGFLGAVPIVGSTIPIAVGAAFGTVQKGESRVTVTFFGDAATEEGVFHESLNFASLKNLPVIFICENNFYSVYSPLSVRRRPDQELYQLAKGYGIPSLKIDGNDVLAIYREAGRAVERAREGMGPTFIECVTYRWREHCGPFYDNDLGYRTVEEFRSWRGRCPIEGFEKKLISEGILNERDMEEMKKNFRLEMIEAVNWAKNCPFPDKTELMENVYA